MVSLKLLIFNLNSSARCTYLNDIIVYFFITANCQSPKQAAIYHTTIYQRLFLGNHSSRLDSKKKRKMEVLLHLQEYADSIESANSDLKSCFWHLTKSRQSHSGGGLLTTSFTAEQLREEFSAQLYVTQDEREAIEPGLVQEGRNTGKSESSSSSSSSTKTWKLTDIIQETKKLQKVASSTISSTAPGSSKTESSSSSDGLRQRKNKKQQEDGNQPSDDKWTMVEETNQDDLLKSDPLTLFGGLTPKELRLAQENARQALQKYIDAANSITAILAELPPIEETKDK